MTRTINDMKCESCSAAFPVTVFVYNNGPAKAKVGKWTGAEEQEKNMREAEIVHNLHYDPKRKGWFATTQDGKEKQFPTCPSRGKGRIEKSAAEIGQEEIIDRIMKNRRLAREHPDAYIQAKLLESSVKLRRELKRDLLVQYLRDELAPSWIELFVKNMYTDYGEDPTEHSSLDSYLKVDCFSPSEMSKRFLARRIAAEFFEPPADDQKVGVAESILSAVVDYGAIIIHEFEKEFQDKEKMSRFVAEIKDISYDAPLKRFMEQSRTFREGLKKKMETGGAEENKKIMLELVPYASTLDSVMYTIMNIKSIEGYKEPPHPSLKKNLMLGILSLASRCPREVGERYMKMFHESFKDS